MDKLQKVRELLKYSSFYQRKDFILELLEDIKMESLEEFRNIMLDIKKLFYF